MSQNYKIVERLGAECFCKNCPTCEAASLIQELGEALEPFVTQKDGSLVKMLGQQDIELAGSIGATINDDTLCEREVTYGDLRRALAILSKLKEA